MAGPVDRLSSLARAMGEMAASSSPDTRANKRYSKWDEQTGFSSLDQQDKARKSQLTALTKKIYETVKEADEGVGFRLGEGNRGAVTATEMRLMKEGLKSLKDRIQPKAAGWGAWFVNVLKSLFGTQESGYTQALRDIEDAQGRIEKAYRERLADLPRRNENLERSNRSLEAKIGRLKEELGETLLLSKEDRATSKADLQARIAILEASLKLKDQDLAEKGASFRELDDDVDRNEQTARGATSSIESRHHMGMRSQGTEAYASRAQETAERARAKRDTERGPLEAKLRELRRDRDGIRDNLSNLRLAYERLDKEDELVQAEELLKKNKDLIAANTTELSRSRPGSSA